MNRSLTPLSGPVKYVHTYLNMYVPLTIQLLEAGDEKNCNTNPRHNPEFRATHSFQLSNGTTVKTCPAALGTQFLRPRFDPENPPETLFRLDRF